MTLHDRIRAVSGLLATAALMSCAGAQPGPTMPAQSYVPPEINYNLISADVAPPEVEWGDDVDFGALRELYGRRRDFGSRCEHAPERKEALAAVQAGELSQILELTDSLLTRCPVDPLLHHWRSSALESVGLPVEAALHRRWVDGLFDSILSTGDGRTKQTPFVTISIYEEYEVLSYLGLVRKSQALVAGPVALDMIVAGREDGSEVIVYFNPALHFLRLYEALE